MKRPFLLLVPLLLACGPFFYQAPPPLVGYPERIPTKPWHEILQEVQPKSDDPAKVLIADCQALIAEFPDHPGSERLVRIDTLIDRNRRGQFQIPLANLLMELREMTETAVPDDQCRPYLAWRAEQLTKPVIWPSTPVRHWNETVAEFEERVSKYQVALAVGLAKYDTRVREAPPLIEPFELVQRGAVSLRIGLPNNASADFQAVAARFPGHPRAEVARFMLGRAALEVARGYTRDHQDPNQAQNQQLHLLREDASRAFNAYLTHHPEGRFVGDAIGWLGAIAYDRGDLGAAIDQQVKRLDHQSTREITRSVLRECDRLIGEVFDRAGRNGFWDERHSADSSEPDYDLLAGHSLVARLFVFHALDPAAQVRFPLYSRNESGDRGTLEFLRRNIILPGSFSRSSLRRLGAAVARSNNAQDPTSLLILGWAATRSGDHAQALTLIDRGLVKIVTDELLHARAVVLTRLDRPAESTAAFDQLFNRFPDSLLTPPSRFDHAIAMQRSGRSGEALLALFDLTGFFRGSSLPREGSAPLYLHPPHEAPQWIDTIAQFAPIQELRAPLDRLPADDPRAALLRAIVRTRALCAGDFDLAARHLDPGPVSPEASDDHRRRWNPRREIFLDQTRWDRELAGLARDERTLKTLPPDDPGTPERHLRVARRWEALRGRVTLPLHGFFDYSMSESPKLDQLRRTNARILGIAPDQIVGELESRDELHHARNHYLAAAGSTTDPEVVAPALEGANRCLFRLAEFSLFAASRAAENGDSARSASIVHRLRTEYPDRPETAGVIPWTFLPPDLLGEWMPGDYSPGGSDRRIAEDIMDDGSGIMYRHRWDLEDGVWEQVRDLRASLDLIARTKRPLDQTRASLARIVSALDDLRPRLDSGSLLGVLNDLEDLSVAAHVPGISPELLLRYAQVRLLDAPAPPIDDSWRPLVPFLEFINLTKPGAGNAATWRAYLKAHPDSPKAEAASLRLIRHEVRASCPIPHVRSFHFPEAPIPNGYKRLTTGTTQASFDPPALNAAIAAHRTRFPDGRYNADLDVLQAAVASRANDYPTALSTLVRIISDRKHPDLRQDASLYFAEICLRLLEPDQRPTLRAAFRDHPRALSFLQNLAHGDTCVSRLRPLLPAVTSAE